MEGRGEDAGTLSVQELHASRSNVVHVNGKSLTRVTW